MLITSQNRAEPPEQTLAAMFDQEKITTTPAWQEFSHHYQLAHQDTMHRLLQSLLREQLVKAKQDGNKIIIALKHKQHFLLIDDVSSHSLGHYKISGNIYFF